MRAALLLQKSMDGSLEFVHANRRGALWGAVTALVQGGRLTLTELGRWHPSKADRKHCIKGISRLLGNELLHEEIRAVYKVAAEILVGGIERPLVLVDWTPVGNKRENYALTAATPIGGRAALLYAEVHPEKLTANRRVEQAFLRALRDILPASCRPVIVTDAGFRTPWFDSLRELGWDYVGRLRHRTLYRKPDCSTWRQTRSLYKQASRTPKDLGELVLTQSTPRTSRLVLVRAKRRFRTEAPPPGPRPQLRRNIKSTKPNPTQRYREAANDPWLLRTSLTTTPARVVAIYETRMQTEQTYRDLKSPRFGWSFDHARTQAPRRIEVLLLIAALAMLALLLIGIAAEKTGIGRRYQANTVRHRRVFSITYLARMLAALRHVDAVKMRDLRAARVELSLLVATYGDLPGG